MTEVFGSLKKIYDPFFYNNYWLCLLVLYGRFKKINDDKNSNNYLGRTH